MLWAYQYYWWIACSDNNLYTLTEIQEFLEIGSDTCIVKHHERSIGNHYFSIFMATMTLWTPFSLKTAWGNFAPFENVHSTFPFFTFLLTKIVCTQTNALQYPYIIGYFERNVAFWEPEWSTFHSDLLNRYTLVCSSNEKIELE